MARDASTYRANRKRADKKYPISLDLKADRKARGETRSQADRRRWEESQNGRPVPPHGSGH